MIVSRRLLGMAQSSGFLLNRILVKSGLMQTEIVARLFQKLYFSYKSLFEPDLVECIRKTVSSGDYVIDVGSGFGFYTKILADSVGSSGKVLAFEPDQTNFIRTRNCFALDATSAPSNECVVVKNLAVSSNNGYSKLLIDGRNPANHRLQDSDNVEGISVQTVTLDSEVESFGLPSFVKIDVQGNELEVLRGATKLIARHKTNFLIEFDPENDGELLQQIWDLMTNRGYEAFEVSNRATLLQLEQLPKRSQYYDVLFKPRTM